MKIIETRPREIGFVLWGHCQNLLDDPRIHIQHKGDFSHCGSYWKYDYDREDFGTSYFWLFRIVCLFMMESGATELTLK